ncbi:MAG: ACT domain-containing protein [Clostridia bacterium]|nr:ACT domain-containing protein [Clostridia bacterium]
MKAVVTVIGVDKAGIIARISTKLYEKGVNILDITQTIMGDIFTMIMLVDVKTKETSFSELVTEMKALGEEIGVEVTVTREEIYKSMHRI